MADVCTVTGKLVSTSGEPLVNRAVHAIPISERGAPMVADTGEHIAAEAVDTVTSADGSFSLNIVRGLTVLFTIDSIGFSKQVTIPDAASVALKDL